MKAFWTEDNLGKLKEAYEDRAKRGDSLEDLEVWCQALAERQGYYEPITMDGIRWQIRKLRSRGDIMHYRDYHTGDDTDLIIGPQVEWSEKQGKPTEIIVQSGSPELDVPVITLDQLLEMGGHPDDLDRFMITSYRRNVWPTTAKDNDGNLVSKNNWQVKATFGLQKPTEALHYLHDKILEDIEATAQRIIPASYYRPVSGAADAKKVMFQPTVVDVHLGNLVWGEESGEDWDMKICERVFKQTVRSLIARLLEIPNLDIEEIVWLIGNDFMHADGKEAKTSNGTQLDLDNRFPKVFRKAWQLQEWAINELRQIAPVKGFVIPGNHDELSAFTVGEVLWALYRHTEDVTIDNSPRLRKYHMYGNTLIGYTHAANEKLASLPGIMHADKHAKQFLSLADYKEIHVGHYHHRKGLKFLPEYEDHNGVLVRVLPSVTATDDWHFGKGFVGSVRAAEGYIYYLEEGLAHVVHSQRKIDLSSDE